MKHCTSILFCTLMAFGLGIPFAQALTEEVGTYVIEYDTVREADTDANGKNDRTSYYKGEQLVWSSSDNDGDGKPDLWLRFAGDAVDLELYDKDGNGSPEKIAEYVSPDRREVIYDESHPSAGAGGDDTTIMLVLVALVAAVFYAKRAELKALMKSKE